MKHKRPGTSFKDPTPLLKQKDIGKNEKLFNTTMTSSKGTKNT